MRWLDVRPDGVTTSYSGQRRAGVRCYGHARPNKAPRPTDRPTSMHSVEIYRTIVGQSGLDLQVGVTGRNGSSSFRRISSRLAETLLLTQTQTLGDWDSAN